MTKLLLVCLRKQKSCIFQDKALKYNNFSNLVLKKSWKIWLLIAQLDFFLFLKIGTNNYLGLKILKFCNIYYNSFILRVF